HTRFSRDWSSDVCSSDLAHEELWLGVIMTGQRAPRVWHAPRERVDVYDIKGAAELALHAAGAKPVEVAPYEAGQGPRYLEQGREVGRASGRGSGVRSGVH